MLTACALLCATIAAPTRWREAALIATALFAPWLAAATVVVITMVSIVRARVDPFGEVAFLQAVASGLRGGMSVRGAIRDAGSADSRFARLVRVCDAGRPMDEVATQMGVELGSSGALAATAVAVGAHSGGQVAAVFSTLAAIRADELELAREVRSSTATVRASMYVVGGLPVVALGYSALTGSARQLAGYGGLGVGVLVSGITLLCLGGGIVVALGRSVTA